MKKILFSFLILFSGLSVWAQQEPQYTMYYFNGFVINPAYAGSWDHAGVTVMGRKQWVGLNGAPTTGSLAFHSPVGKSLHGIGISMIGDKIGVTQQYTLNGAFAYRMQVGPGKLGMALQLSATNYQADFTSVPRENVSDPAFAGNMVNVWHPNAGAGLYYNTERFFAGISTPRLVKNKLYETGVTGLTGSRYVHFLATVGGVINLNESIQFKPSTLIKFTETGQWAMDLNASFLFNQKFWAGISYRHQDAIAGVVEYMVSPQFRFGYSYDFTLSKLFNSQSGSHELMIGWEFTGSKKGLSSPRYF